uniref:X-box-binding protein 1 n=1 Tax=Cynoglossus semilaevis TaxID=244447 RepID=A0A3P8UXN0_CYNSE
MITRRRGRTISNTPSMEAEVMDAVETVIDLPSPSDGFPPEDSDDIMLRDLFKTEGMSWALERDPASILFDMELSDLGLFCHNDQDSGFDASSSPDRIGPTDLKNKNRRNQSSCVINKNAIAARLNRIKKKEYVTSLEEKVSVLSTENTTLKQENSQLTKRVEELEDETRYLRAVLANESMLAQLLSRLSGVNGMKLSSSLFQGPDGNDHDGNDHDYALPRKRIKVEEKETSGGICLHVDKNQVSVEFCTKCAQSANASLKIFF